ARRVRRAPSSHRRRPARSPWSPIMATTTRVVTPPENLKPLLAAVDVLRTRLENYESFAEVLGRQASPQFCMLHTACSVAAIAVETELRALGFSGADLLGWPPGKVWPLEAFPAVDILRGTLADARGGEGEFAKDVGGVWRLAWPPVELPDLGRVCTLV